MMDDAITLAGISSVAITASELLALTTCIGILGFRLWVVSALDDVPTQPAGFLTSMWWLLGLCLVVLTFTSIGELIRRASEMSGQPVRVLPFLLAEILFETHFGWVWLLRTVALLILWIGWRIRPDLNSSSAPAAMLAAACLVAASRSLSGHAADWGDFTLAELMDWTHLLAASVWSGSLIALAATRFHSFLVQSDRRRQVIADMAYRWSVLAGASLAVVGLTGIYNAWLELQRFQALWETAYGRLLVLKLILVFAIVVLGATNRYVGLPSLKSWARGRSDNGGHANRLVAILPLLLGGRVEWEARAPLARFVHVARLESVIMIGTVLCVAVLLSQMPARHVAYGAKGQHPHTHRATHSEPSRV